MREVHPIPTAMVQPWMPLGIAYMLLMLSMGVPLVVFLFVKSLWIALAIPLLMLISYRVTAKDLYRFEVMSVSTTRSASTRSKAFWKGAKTYVPF